MPSADADRAAPPGGEAVLSGSRLADGPAGFAAIAAAFDRAAAATRGAAVFDCRFAGRPVRVRTAGRRLAETVARAVVHLADPAPPEPVLAVDLWDGAETGVPWHLMAAEDGLGVEHWFAVSDDQRFVVQEQPHGLTWFDRAAGRIVGWVSDARDLALAERARVTYPPMLLWLHDQGLRIAHAGLAAWEGRGLLVPGESGQGKSTLALSCLQDGLDFVSDDHVWLEPAPGAGGFLGHGLYGSTNLTPDNLERFPALAAHALAPVNPRPSEHKSLVFLHPLFPGRVRGSARVAAVAMPRVVRGTASTFRPAGKGETLVTLARTLVTDWKFKRTPNPADRFGVFAALVDAVPCYWLCMGQDLADVARCARDLLAEAGPP